MTQWQELGLEAKITRILGDVHYYKPDHHFGRPFLTAYQLAIAFARRYPEDAETIGLPIGGKGVGRRNSLAQRLAGDLSRLIKAGRLPHIEGAFLSNRHLKDIFFEGGIPSSLTESGYDLSMFRLRDIEGRTE